MPRAVGANHHLSRLDACSDLEPGRPQLHRGARRTQRVVLVSGRDSEETHQHVPDDLLDGRAVAPEHGGRDIGGTRHDPARRLGVRGPERNHELDEDDRDSPSLRREPRLGLPAWTAIQRAVLPEDRLLELPQRRSRLDAQLLDQRPAGVAIFVEGVRLPSGAVERQHELGA